MQPWNNRDGTKQHNGAPAPNQPSLTYNKNAFTYNLESLTFDHHSQSTEHHENHPFSPPGINVSLLYSIKIFILLIIRNDNTSYECYKFQPITLKQDRKRCVTLFTLRDDQCRHVSINKQVIVVNILT